MIHLILGGRRSGKTRFAEQLAHNSAKQVHYIATAQVFDTEMGQRAKAHQAERPPTWYTHETPFELAKVLAQFRDDNHCLLVDCLTMWVTNMLCADYTPEQIAGERKALIDVIQSSRATIIFVSNETGLGIVPEGALTRRYCDEAGILHQEIAALADHAALIVAGLPLTLKNAAATGT